MPKLTKNKQRVECHLETDVVKKLILKAKDENRSLKNYCESLLIAAVTLVAPKNPDA